MSRRDKKPFLSDQNHPEKKKYKNAKEKDIRKGKGEKERYTHLSAEFQRIAKNQAFLADP